VLHIYIYIYIYIYDISSLRVKESKITRIEISYTQTVTKAINLPTNNYDKAVSVNCVKNFILHIFIMAGGGMGRANHPAMTYVLTKHVRKLILTTHSKLK